VPARRTGSHPTAIQRQALDRVPAPVPRVASQAAAATGPFHRAVLPRRGDRVRRWASPVRALPPRGLPEARGDLARAASRPGRRRRDRCAAALEAHRCGFANAPSARDQHAVGGAHPREIGPLRYDVARRSEAAAPSAHRGPVRRLRPQPEILARPSRQGPRPREWGTPNDDSGEGPVTQFPQLEERQTRNGNVRPLRIIGGISPSAEFLLETVQPYQRVDDPTLHRSGSSTGPGTWTSTARSTWSA